MIAVRTATDPITLAMIEPGSFGQHGLRQLFEHDPRFKLLAIAVAPQVLETRLEPDVLLLDPPAGRTQSESMLLAARERFPGSACLLLTDIAESGFVTFVFRNGARALLAKSHTTPENLADVAYTLGTADLIISDRQVFERVTRERRERPDWLLPASTVSLTPQELNVLRQLANGLNDEEIARALGIKRTTVETHVSNLRQKLPVANRVQLGIYAVGTGLIDLRSIEFHG